MVTVLKKQIRQNLHNRKVVEMLKTNRKTKLKSRRGFAAMDPQKQRDIASKGGRAAHQKGTAHEWTSEEARRAGKVGGQANLAI